jgi:hypothetical protein
MESDNIVNRALEQSSPPPRTTFEPSRPPVGMRTADFQYWAIVSSSSILLNTTGISIYIANRGLSTRVVTKPDGEQAELLNGPAYLAA